MPLAMLKRRNTVEDAVLTKVCDNLQEIVAKRLHCQNDPSGYLTKEDVEVWFFEANQFDRTGNYKFSKPYDLQIVVEANDVPESVANIEERQRQIATDVASLLPTGLTAFVWIRPGPGQFGELIGSAVVAQ